MQAGKLAATLVFGQVAMSTANAASLVHGTFHPSQTVTECYGESGMIYCESNSSFIPANHIEARMIMQLLLFLCVCKCVRACVRACACASVGSIYDLNLLQQPYYLLKYLLFRLEKIENKSRELNCITTYVSFMISLTA